MKTRVIGVGNPFRRDDSVGLLAVRKLRTLVRDGVDFQEASGEGADLMERWSTGDRIYLVDAVRSGAVPGTIYRLDAATERIPSTFFSYSTHAFSVAEAVELARKLDRLPTELIIFGIEGDDFSMGEGVTPAVQAAVSEVVDDIRQCVVGLLRED